MPAVLSAFPALSGNAGRLVFGAIFLACVRNPNNPISLQEQRRPATQQPREGGISIFAFEGLGFPLRGWCAHPGELSQACCTNGFHFQDGQLLLAIRVPKGPSVVKIQSCGRDVPFTTQVPTRARYSRCNKPLNLILPCPNLLVHRGTNTLPEPPSRTRR